MDKNAIKKYAIWAREELIRRVSTKAEQYGITKENVVDAKADSVHGRLLSGTEKKQRAALIAKIRAEGYEQVMEETAYTWFNRFIALRFMEVNNYLPSHVRVFTDEDNHFNPQILAEAIHLELDGLDMDRVIELKQKNDDDTLYKYLLITQCNALNGVLPVMFQKIDDESELLFPDNLLREGSVLDRLIQDIQPEDWEDQVQIIGWLYQYYNTVPKDNVFADLKKNIKISKEKIPAATQLFTPDWIVRYMVENSLGRLWIEGHPEDAGLKADWKYYLEEAEQEPEVQAQLVELRREYARLTPMDLKVIDPCSGSGHICAYLFDVLMQIYDRAGYTPRQAVRSILENNLYGLDIDDRAAQLTYFAVMMKGCRYDSRFLTRTDADSRPDVPQPNVFAITDSGWTGGKYPFDMGNFLLSKEHQETLNCLLEAFRDAKEYGSLLKLEQRDYTGLWEAWQNNAQATAENVNMLLWYSAVEKIVPVLIKQAILLTQKYDVVVTNPPYMGGAGMNGKLTDFVKKNYPDSKSDLSTAFMEQTIRLCNEYGYMSMINIPAWMFLSSYEKLREKMIKHNTFINMVHPGRGIFGSDFGTTTFVIWKKHIPDYSGSYRRLFDKQGEVESITEREQAFLSGKGAFIAQQDNFSKIPGAPVAYWVGNQIYNTYSYPPIGNTIIPRHGLATSDNNRFLKLWFEVSLENTSIQKRCNFGKKWFPMNKGGAFRKWYGNLEWVINYENDGQEIKSYAIELYKTSSRTIQNTQFYFKEAITWSALTSGALSFRWSDVGAIFGSGAHCAFASDSDTLLYGLALMNGKVSAAYLNIMSPTLNTNVDDIRATPYIEDKKDTVVNLVRRCIRLSKLDWDSFETSWDFTCHPLVQLRMAGAYSWGDNPPVMRISSAYKVWELECEGRFTQLKANEEELNRIFIDIYGLQDGLTPEVEDKNVTVRRADLGRDIRSLISYAVGCIFGRYSPYKEGLIYAGGEWDYNQYENLAWLAEGKPDVLEFHKGVHVFPDQDNIIPICDDEYFADDIVGRFVEFIDIVYGHATLEENLKFIADALGGKGSPVEVIRSYFRSDFYADHCRIYQKRPIYWLFDSGKKGGFKALIYMHRYQPDTLARMRTDYVHEQQARYRTAIDGLERRIAGASTAERVKLNKQLSKLKDQDAELRGYEEKIHHLADQMIAIDLDDGVKVNYAKFQDVLAKIK